MKLDWVNMADEYGMRVCSGLIWVGFDTLTAVSMDMAVFLVVAPLSP